MFVTEEALDDWGICDPDSVVATPDEMVPEVGMSDAMAESREDAVTADSPRCREERERRELWPGAAALRELLLEGPSGGSPSSASGLAVVGLPTAPPTASLRRE